MPDSSVPADDLTTAGEPRVRASMRVEPRRWGIPLLAGVVALLLLAYMFSPNYAAWKAMGIVDAMIYPETNRAVWSLIQLEQPFIEVTNESNSVIEWRLLFPLIGHYLNLPHRVYLAIPFVGSLLTLSGIAGLLLRRGAGFWPAVALTVALGGMSWLFVSIGWLGYFDGWTMGSLIVAAFAPRRWALAAACLLSPWIDERFILALPAVFAVRWHMARRAAPAGDPIAKRWMIDAGVALVCVALYLAVRAAPYIAGTDEGSQSYIDKHLAEITRVPWWLRLWGAWDGLRVGWVLVGVFIWDCWRSRRSVAHGMAVTAVVALTLIGASVIAGDLSRSTCMLLPVAVAGAVILLRDLPGVSRWASWALLAASLAIPAHHVVTHLQPPIYYLPYQMDLLRRPPTRLSTDFYFTRGTEHFRAGEHALAICDLTWAIQLDAGNAVAYANRAASRLMLGDTPGTLADLRAALATGNLTAQDEAAIRNQLTQLQFQR